MTERVVTIANRRGLHARASAKFVTLASELRGDVEVCKDGQCVVATSIMGLMMLGAAIGDAITIRGTGADSEEAVERLAQLVEDKFGED